MAKSRPVRRRVAASHLPFGAPARAWALAEWSLLPLRAFLGVTFLFAGLQKLANPDFFNASSPASIQAQIIGSVRLSPVGSLLGHFLQFATPLGIIIALSEVAIGVGTSIGLWGRIAALGGVLLSFTLFLTVSFHASPYYTGADIVFLFAWIPLVIAGSGSRLSLDALIAARVSKEKGTVAPELVAVPFAQVQMWCGNFANGTCRARQGEPCAPRGCPALEGPRPSLPARRSVDDVDRRTLVVGSLAAAVVAGASAGLAGLFAGLGRAFHSSSSSSPSSTTTTVPGQTTTTTAFGTKIGSLSSFPVGSAVSFTIASSGDPGIAVRTGDATFKAYDAVCPHAGCTVGYSAPNSLLVCPCHASEFQVSDGSLITGPSPTGLTALQCTVHNGDVYIA